MYKSGILVHNSNRIFADIHEKEFTLFFLLFIIKKESDKMNCIFCKIIEGELSSFTIYEDDIVKVFLDVNPDSNGHLLIIPKKHILDINEMDSTTWNHILDVTKKMRKLLEEKLQIDGLTLIENNGMVQEVKHFHLHLKPFYKDPQAMKPIEEIYSRLIG